MQNGWYEMLRERWFMADEEEYCMPGMFELKHMVCLPGGKVQFMSRDESCEWLDECEEPKVLEMCGLDLYALFDENDVIEYNQQRYIVGPVVILFALYPFDESDLSGEEIINVMEWLHHKETLAPLGDTVVPAFVLDEVETWG